MKMLFLLVVSLLVSLKTSVAQSGLRLQPPPPQRPRFNFGRFQPMVNAIFSRPNRFRRPAPHHLPANPQPVLAKAPPRPVMKPPFDTQEKNHNLPKKMPTVPFPPPPPPRHLVPDVSPVFHEDGFGTPRPNSIIKITSNLKEGNLDFVPELKPLHINDVANIFIHSLPETQFHSDQFIPLIQPPQQQKLKGTNFNQQDFNLNFDGKNVNSTENLISLNPIELNPEGISFFIANEPAFFDTEPLKPNTLIQSQIHTGDTVLDVSNVRGLSPPPFEESVESFQGLTHTPLSPEANFFPISVPQTTNSFFQESDHKTGINGVEIAFPDSFPAINAGILPLADELPDELQRFPPFLN